MNSKLSRRVVARAVAAKLVAEPAKRAHWIKVLAAYLVEQNKVEDIDLLVNDIAHELYDQTGHLLVDVTSARPLTEAIRDELKRTLRQATSAVRVELSEHVDRDLLGGLVARTPDGQLDVSVRSQLRQLAAIK
ncbi:MAG TPA: F0F1 ATP synthase subunit delta [Nevskiaceae bacterium]|nr:F0F1 ATP synthase subunit delta [Nevskiaceae bacterium]